VADKVEEQLAHYRAQHNIATIWEARERVVVALARGLVEAMGGALAPDDTPGGGLTMIVTVPAVASHAESLPVR
jgi:K+-sensing histidine kinase KdpD